MGRKVLFSEFPASIPLAGEAGDHRYLQSDSMHAVLGDAAGKDKILFTLEKPRAVICQGVPAVGAPSMLEKSKLVPVYQIDGQGTPAIPTGDILVRRPAGQKIAEIQHQLEQLGYVLTSILSYAPQAGWVQARSGSLEDSLRGYQELARLPEVEHVEPQMVGPSEQKSV